MLTIWPLPRYWPQISASRSHVTTLWYSAFSAPPRYSLVAMENCVTVLPLARLLTSGSRVRRPVSTTRFIRDLLGPARMRTGHASTADGGLDRREVREASSNPF